MPYAPTAHATSTVAGADPKSWTITPPWFRSVTRSPWSATRHMYFCRLASNSALSYMQKPHT
eukprot:8363121-Lingulodinium_polyedra.AAC.1